MFIWVWFPTHISKIWTLPVRCAPLRPRPPPGPVPRLIHGDATRPVCLCHGRPVRGAAGLIQFSAAAGRITAAAWQNCRLARVQYYQVPSITKCRELAKYGVRFHIWYATPPYRLPPPATSTLHSHDQSQVAQANHRAGDLLRPPIEAPEGPHFAYSRHLVRWGPTEDR